MTMTFRLLCSIALFSTLSFAKAGDGDVNLDDTVTFDQHFKKWDPQEPLKSRQFKSGVIVGAESLTALFFTSLARSQLDLSDRHLSVAHELESGNYVPKVNAKKRPLHKTRLLQAYESAGSAKRIGNLSNLAALYFVVDAVAGTVLAMKGQRPLVMLNAPALASYLVRNTLDGEMRNESTTQAERNDAALLMKALYGVPLRAGEAVRLDQHFETWSIADNKFETLANVGAIQTSAIVTGVAMHVVAKRHTNFTSKVHELRADFASAKDVKMLAKTQRFNKRLGLAGRALAVVFLFEAVSGTVVAVKDHKPVYVGNFAGLTSYLYRKGAAQGLDVEPEKDSFLSRFAENFRIKELVRAADREILQAIYAESPELQP